MKVDLSLLFSTYAKRFETEIKDKIRRKIGLDGARYSLLKDWALAVSRKPGSRLNDAGKFQQNAVVSVSDDVSLKVKGNPNSHTGAITFDDIIGYNNRGSATVNSDIENPPLIMPNTEAEVIMMDTYKKFEADLLKTIEIQTGEDLQKFGGKTTIEVSGG